MKVIKINWQTELLDKKYRENGYPEKVWKDNEGKPFGIHGFTDDEMLETLDITWYATEKERDKEFELIN